MHPILETEWHTLPIGEVRKKLGTGEHGLESAEARARLERDGLNKLPESKTESIAAIFLRQFQSPIIYILLLAALSVFVIGEAVDGAVIMAVLVFNALIGSIQEGRARNTLLALKRFVQTQAMVIRDDKELIVPDSQVVIGDVISLQEGERVPADARIITASNLKIDEAALTGESEAAHKTHEALKNTSLSVLDQKNMAFKGTHVVSGHGRALVVRTGAETVVGKIAGKIAEVETEIPLKTNIRYLSRIIIVITLTISALIFVFGLNSGKPAMEMLATVISISVSVIPEGLPVAITVILAAGVWRMSKRNALVKRLQAVEALGQASVIAVDKTGTITKNEMMVQTIYVGDQTFEVDGLGYDPKGGFRLEGSMTDPQDHPGLLLAGKLAAFGNNAKVMLESEKGTWKISGDPTEAAIFIFAKKTGFEKEALEERSPLLSETPFDYKLKYRATAHKHGKQTLITAIGAPETILGLSTKVWNGGRQIRLSDKERERLEARFLEISKRGLRVIAIALKRDDSQELPEKELDELTFVAFLGLKDTLRLEVKEAAKRASEAGIKVVMITGDHQITAQAIAREALIFKDGDLMLTGKDIESLDDRELGKRLDNVSIFARVTPEHKLRIINAYKSRGEIVAMTGDGVNDAPSLVAADLGVAMGKIGTEVAKEASDIVLLDDNFGSIVSAIEEGRSIYKTIKKVILYLFSTSIGELLVIIGAIFLGFPLPLLPAQIIWLNFVTDGFFTVALAMEPREKGLLTAKFEKPNKYLIDAVMVQRMLIMAIPMMLGTLILFSSFFEADLAKAWTVSLTILAIFQWFNAWNCRSERISIFRMNPFSNISMVLATLAALCFQLLAVYNPLFQKFLRTVPLAFSDWAIIIALATSIIVVEEIRKSLSWRTKKSWSSSGLPLQANRI